MTEKNFLYKCTFCLNENINGKILNQNTFNRHRTRIQEFSKRDDKNMYIEENIYLDIEENIHLNTEENIHLDIEEEQIEKNIDDALQKPYKLQQYRIDIKSISLRYLYHS